MKIKAFTGIGTRRRQEDDFAIIDISYNDNPSESISTSTALNSSDSTVTSETNTTEENSVKDNTTNVTNSSQTISQCTTKTRNLIVVADGMGGHDYGDVASYMVVNEITDYWKQHPDECDSPEKIKKAVIEAGKAYEDNAEGREMGSTMVMAAIEGNQVYIAHCGDSRIYVWRKDTHQFFHTNDHIRISEFGWELVANAFFTGHCSEIVPEIRKLELNHGDRLMLCTDGVFKFVPRDQLRRLFTDEEDLSEAAESIEVYCQAISRDNYTAVLVEF